MSGTRPSRMLRRLQWIGAAFCAVEIALLAIDRGTISLAAVPIRGEFKLTAAAIGAMISAWSVAYALSQFAVGYLIDLYGVRKVLGVALLVWSAAQAAGGLAMSYTQLLYTRIVLGVGEAPATPTAVRVIGTWFQPQERGLPTGLYSATTTVGPAIALPILTMVMVTWTWREMFVVAGVAGIIAAVLWMIIYRSPHEIDWSKFPPEDRAYVDGINSEPLTKVTLRQWGRLFKCRSIIGLLAGSYGIGYMFWVYIAWLPTFLESTYHLSVRDSGIFSAFPWMGGLVGAFVSGYISDRWAKRGMHPVMARKIPASIGLLGMAGFTALAVFASTVPFALFCIFMTVCFGTFLVTAQLSLATVIAPRAYLGTAGSIANLGSYIGATCSPILTGFFLDATGSFDVALLTSASIGVVCAFLFFFIIKEPVVLSDIEPSLRPSLAAGQ